MIELDLGALRHRTQTTLMTAQALGAAALAISAAVISLLAAEIAGGDGLAGIPAAMMTLGTAAFAGPLAARAVRLGRRKALAAGFGIATLGALAAVAAGQLRLFPLLAVAMFLFGAGQSASLQTRFAATDLAEPAHQARSIAIVVWMGTVGGVLGPVLSPWQESLGPGWGLGRWVSPILFTAGFYLLAFLVITTRLRPDPLLTARRLDPYAGVGAPSRQRSWQAIASSPTAVLAIITIAVSQSSMVAVMVMTPLHMKDHGQADLSPLVLAAHVLGMFGFAPLVGRLADWKGPLFTIRLGGLILATGTIGVVVAGYQPVLVFAGLFLLGLGWCFGLIAGSALLTSSVPAEHRVASQGSADLIMSACAAGAAFASGLVKATVGFHWLANFATVAALMLVIAVTWRWKASTVPA
jgi:MFS family permease